MTKLITIQQEQLAALETQIKDGRISLMAAIEMMESIGVTVSYITPPVAPESVVCGPYRYEPLPRPKIDFADNRIETEEHY